MNGVSSQSGITFTVRSFLAALKRYRQYRSDIQGNRHDSRQVKLLHMGSCEGRREIATIPSRTILCVLRSGHRNAFLSLIHSVKEHGTTSWPYYLMRMRTKFFYSKGFGSIKLSHREIRPHTFPLRDGASDNGAPMYQIYKISSSLMNCLHGSMSSVPTTANAMQVQVARNRAARRFQMTVMTVRD